MHKEEHILLIDLICLFKEKTMTDQAVSFYPMSKKWVCDLLILFVFQTNTIRDQGTFNWRTSSYSFIQNYFLLKRIFDFFC